MAVVYKDHLTASLAAVRQRVQKLRPLKHKPTQGTINEIITRELLTKILPTPATAVSGIIVDANGTESDQNDVIIIDERIMRPLLHESGIALCPIESVIAVVEVKTSLKTAHVTRASKCAAKFLKKVRTFADNDIKRFAPPLWSVFAFDSELKTNRAALRNSSIGRDWLDENADGLMGVCALGCFSWMVTSDGRGDYTWKLHDENVESFEETKRYLGVLADQVRTRMAVLLNAFYSGHRDLAGRYLRTQEGLPSGRIDLSKN